jgi:hypothetical protein
MEPQELVVLLVIKEPQAHQVLPVPPALKEPQVYKAAQAYKGQPASQAHKALQVYKAAQEHKGQPASQEQVEPLAQAEFKEP